MIVLVIDNVHIIELKRVHTLKGPLHACEVHVHLVKQEAESAIQAASLRGQVHRSLGLARVLHSRKLLEDHVVRVLKLGSKRLRYDNPDVLGLDHR